MSTAHEFRLAAEARRQAAAALESIQSDAIVKMAKIQERQLVALAPVFDLVNSQLFADMRKTMQLYNNTFQSITIPSRQLIDATQAWQTVFNGSIFAELQKSLRDSVAFTINFERPLFYAPQFLEEAVLETVEVEQIDIDNELLSVSIDQFGSFIIGGRKIVRANAKTSQYGQLLKLFEDRKGEMVSANDIRSQVKTTNPKQALKDLKRQLKLQGYTLNYEPYRSQGWVYHGIITKQ